MAVVVDHRDAARLPASWKRRSTPRKWLIPSAILAGIDLQLVSDGHRRSSVEHVVPPGHMQFKRAEQARCSRNLEARVHAPFGGKRFQPVVGVARDSVGQHAPPRTRQNRGQLRIVDAGRHGPVERHLVHEVRNARSTSSMSV